MGNSYHFTASWSLACEQVRSGISKHRFLTSCTLNCFQCLALNSWVSWIFLRTHCFGKAYFYSMKWPKNWRRDGDSYYYCWSICGSLIGMIGKYWKVWNFLAASNWRFASVYIDIEHTSSSEFDFSTDSDCPGPSTRNLLIAASCQDGDCKPKVTSFSQTLRDADWTRFGRPETSRVRINRHPLFFQRGGLEMNVAFW